MYFDRKATCRYLRRRHKLYKAINNDLHDTSPITQSVPLIPSIESQECNRYQLENIKKAFTQTFSHLLQENLDIFQILESIKINKKAFEHFSEVFLQNVLLATQFHSGHKLAYVIKNEIQIVYRFCRQYPEFFKKIVSILNQKLTKKVNSQSEFGIQLCIFYTDLFLYGFNLTGRTFLDKIFIYCEPFIIDYVIRLPPIYEWEVFVPKRYVFKLKSSSQNWMNLLILKTKSQFQKLQSLADEIQQNIVQTKTESRLNRENTPEQLDRLKNLETEYVELYDQFQTTRQKLEYLEKEGNIKPARTIDKVRQQCEHYDPLFRLPQLLHKLYKERQIPKMQIKRIKKGQMIDIFDDEAFLTQLRMCGSVEMAVDLSAYFIANLSTENNRQELVQYIIDCCHHESNLDLILKVLTQINCQYPQLGQFMNKKSYKIASQIKMNKKYLNLICQGTKFGMIDTAIILEYVEKRLITEHTEMNILETVKESCSILELLGQSIYHESLKTNIAINKLFDLIEQKIKEKKLNSQFSFNLRCVKKYLRRTHFLPQILQKSAHILQNQTLSELTSEFNLYEHFDLILKRIKQLLTSKINNKTEQSYNKKRIVNYIVSSIQNESNFIQTFYQASLVNQINHKEIKEEMIEKCVQKIQASVDQNIQQSLKWSRFLGELYNYEILSRKRLTQILEGKLLYCAELITQDNFEKMVKCVLECLNISKSIILESEVTRQSNQFILNFLVKFKRSILKHLTTKSHNKYRFDNIMTEQQLQEMLTYFHPCLLQKLKTVEEIDLWSQKVKFSSPKDSLLSVNLYKVLQYYSEFEKSEQFDPTMMEGFVKKPKPQKQKQSNGNKTQKKVLYKQKLPEKPQTQVKTQVKTQIKTQVKIVPQITKPAISAKQLLIDKQIQEINQNFRNEEQQELPQEQKILLKEEEQNLQKQLKQMMGITPQQEMNEKFPELNQRNLKKKKDEQLENINRNNFKKLLKNEQGKRMKIIARKLNHPIDIQN